MRPDPARSKESQKLLGVSMEVLVETAEQLMPEVQAEEERARRNTVSRRHAEGTSSGLPLKQRLAMLEDTIDQRIKAVGDLSDRFNSVHDRARDQFFLPFIRTAQSIFGAPHPPEPVELRGGGPDQSGCSRGVPPERYD